MESTISVINLMPSGRDQLESFKFSLKREILAATHDPLKILVQLKYAEKTIADILKDEDIEDCFLGEAHKYSTKEATVINGAIIRVQEVGTKYDYDGTGDPLWSDLNNQIAELTERKKEREKFLQTIPIEGTADPNTGVMIYRAPKTSKTKVVVTIK